jgi:hypothetical protein
MRRFTAICDRNPFVGGNACLGLERVLSRFALLPTALCRVAAAPSEEFVRAKKDLSTFKRFRSIKPEPPHIPKPVRVTSHLFDACECWFDKRYRPLAYAEIRRLWPELSVSSLTNIIIDYFG